MRIRFAAVAAVAVLLAVQPGPARADTSVQAAGPFTLNIPGLGACQGVAKVSVRVAGADWLFHSLIAGGQGSFSAAAPAGAFCALQDLNFLYGNQKPTLPRQCQPTPIGVVGTAEVPGSIAVNGNVVTATTDGPDCVGNKILIVHTITLGPGTAQYSFQEWINTRPPEPPFITGGGALTRGA